MFDVNAVQETIQICRTGRKPYAVVLNGAPAQRDGLESPIVTIARESLTKFRAPVWGGQITNRADLLMALSHGEGAREYYAEGRAAAEISRLWAAIERSVKAIRGAAPATARCTSRRRNKPIFRRLHLADRTWLTKSARPSARFSFAGCRSRWRAYATISM